MLRILAAFLLSFSLLSPFVAYAEEAATETETGSTTEETLKRDSVTDRLENRKEKQEIRAENRKERLEIIKENAQERREALKEKNAERKELLKERLAKIKDVRKQKVVTNLNEKMARINTRRTEHFRKVLIRLDEHLTRIEEKRDELKAAGKDTSAVDTAINTANDKLAAAQEAVEEQAGKDYTLTIGTEATLKTTVGAEVKKEQEDLMKTKESVNAARLAIYEAVQALKSLAISGETTNE